MSGECEQVWRAVKCGVETILCGAIYRKPGYDRSSCDSAILKSMCRAAGSDFDGVLICGDFNHPAVSWTEEGSPYIDIQSTSNTVSDKFVDCIQSLHLVQLICEPSFIGAGGILAKTIIDLIFTDINQRISSVIHEEPLYINIQAHHVLSFQFAVSPAFNKLSKCIAKPCYRKGDYKAFSNYFDGFQDTWDQSFAGSDINECLSLFMDI